MTGEIAKMTEEAEIHSKASLIDLTKIPAKEFEKQFHEWMERDDVARALQAKLRCDLIQNFNKTNLGKQMMAYAVNHQGDSTYRLTLSPLILSLNTLVAEFLYAENCHFTLSVFCTEVPFRNALPDFERMRNFRFNKAEIADIWHAIAGHVPSLEALNVDIIRNYTENHICSLLMLVLKYLVEQRPLEQLKHNVQVQTESHQKHLNTASVQATEAMEGNFKETADSGFAYFNKYLQILVNRVNDMTKEFENFSKRRHMLRCRQFRSTRFRDYRTLNHSLERITQNLREAGLAKRKNKRLQTVINAMEGLTNQFEKCTQNFAKIFNTLQKQKEKTKSTIQLRKNVKEQETETEAYEKSYTEWIYEMRNTASGQRFLNKVEHILRKALNKYKEELESETNMKIKQLKRLMKLHYKQKLLMHLTRLGIKEDTDNTQDTIAMKLQNFELKQMEILEKLRDTSFQLKRPSDQQVSQAATNRNKKEERVGEPQQQQPEHQAEHQQQQLQQAKEQIHYPTPNPEAEKPSKQTAIKEINTKLHIDITKECLERIFTNITHEEHKVHNIIYDAKWRLHELECEGNEIEQNFLSYLERRRVEELENIKLQRTKQTKRRIPPMSLEILKEVSMRTYGHHTSTEESDREFKRIRQKLQDNEMEQEKQLTNRSCISRSSSSSISSVELRNAILEAKIKFFDDERKFRQRKKRELLLETSEPDDCNVDEPVAEMELIPAESLQRLAAEGKLQSVSKQNLRHADDRIKDPESLPDLPLNNANSTTKLLEKSMARMEQLFQQSRTNKISQPSDSISDSNTTTTKTDLKEAMKVIEKDVLNGKGKTVLNDSIETALKSTTLPSSKLDGDDELPSTSFKSKSTTSIQESIKHKLKSKRPFQAKELTLISSSDSNDDCLSLAGVNAKHSQHLKDAKDTKALDKVDRKETSAFTAISKSSSENSDSNLQMSIGSAARRHHSQPSDDSSSDFWE